MTVGPARSPEVNPDGSPAVVAGPGDMLGAPVFGLRPDGGGVVLAQGAFDGSETGIAGALLRANGTVRGELFPVNASVAGVVWESRTADGASEIRAQVIAGSGRLRGREIRIGGPAAGTRHQPDVAGNAAGEAVVVYAEAALRGFESYGESAAEKVQKTRGLIEWIRQLS